MNRGFTLVEVLVALAIFSLALVTAIRTGQAGELGFVQTRERLLADWVAADRLAELRANRAWPEPGNSEGETVQGGDRFQWRQKVSTTPNRQFRHVIIEVTNSNGGVVAAMAGLLWRQGKQ